MQDASPISSRAIKTEVFREVEKIPPIVQKIIVLKKGTVDDNVAFLNILKLVGKLPRKVVSYIFICIIRYLSLFRMKS